MPVNKRTKPREKNGRKKERKQCCVIIIYVADRSGFDSGLL